MERARKYLTTHGITMIQDEIREVAGVTLIGRDDISSSRFGRQRKELSEILQDVSKDRPLILLDHQPKNLSEAQKNGVDVQFSGHTHNGQLWPLNLIVKHLFEVPVGYKKKGDTHIFVSTGVGTWGPPVRTNARPDILFVTVEFS
jgi:predicted MPP superfamily phosphohydrolase